MSRVVHKVFFAWQADEEESWINEMAQQGWALVTVGVFRYEFESCERGAYTYRIELLENRPANRDSIAYLGFLSDAGIEYIGSILRWVYLRKKNVDGPFELYSDLSSKIGYFRRLRAFFISLFIMELWIGTFNLILAMQSINSIQSINLFCAFLLYGIGVILGVAIKKQTNQIKTLQRERTIRE